MNKNEEVDYPMAMNIIENISICRLGGFVGSNPEVISSVLPISSTEEQALLCKALPDGTEPNSYILEKLNNKYILSYTFTIKSNDETVRDDLASIALVMPDKKVNIEDFKILFKLVMDSFKDEMETINLEQLKYMIERIYNGINKGEKIAIENVSIDVPSIVKNKKLKIITEAEKIAGRIF